MDDEQKEQPQQMVTRIETSITDRLRLMEARLIAAFRESEKRLMKAGKGSQ